MGLTLPRLGTVAREQFHLWVSVTRSELPDMQGVCIWVEEPELSAHDLWGGDLIQAQGDQEQDCWGDRSGACFDDHGGFGGRRHQEPFDDRQLRRSDGEVARSGDPHEHRNVQDRSHRSHAGFHLESLGDFAERELAELEGCGRRTDGYRLEQQYDNRQARVGRSSVRRYRTLGEFGVSDDARDIEVGPPQRREILALLLVSANHVVRRDRIVDAIWPDCPPDNAVSSVHAHLSRIRAAIGPERLRTRGAGYVLSVDRDEFDIDVFRHLAAEGRQALTCDDTHRAWTLFGSALDLWHGEAFVDFKDALWCRGTRHALDETRLSVVESRLDCELVLGFDPAPIVAQLVELVAENPTRERFCTQLVVSLYRAGRYEDALDMCRRHRQRLRDRGLEPSPAFAKLESAVLNHSRLLLAGAADVA